MAERKSATNLTDEERDSLLAAVLNMKATIVNPGEPEARQISLFDQFEAIHIGCLSVTVPSGSTVNMGHQGPRIFAVAPGISLKVREGARSQRLRHRSSLLGLDRSQRNVRQVVCR